jgi:acetyl esterase/lipase
MTSPLPFTLRLYPGPAPGSESWQNQPKDTVLQVPFPHRFTRNIVDPDLTVYLPDAARATGTGIIVAPGGGHHFLAVDHEGSEIAEWLVSRGIAAFVLRYRVIQTSDDDTEFEVLRGNLLAAIEKDLDGHWPLAIADAQRAIDLVRSKAEEWNLKEDRIGMMGFSAGAHLTYGVLSSGAKLDFIAPVYGALWGSDIRVPDKAPPLFTVVASDDPISVVPCLDIYKAWHKAGKSAELHVYSKGNHGFGMVKQGLPSDGWTERFEEWLKHIRE